MRNLFFSLLCFFATTVFAQAPANDEACTATTLTVNNVCNFVTATNVDATTSPEADPGCGNYAGGDVWFQAVVPANGILKVTTQPGTSLTDGAMAFYTGASCSALTQIACDRNSAPGSGSMPEITASGLTPGSTIWIRFWENNNNDFGTFEICATTPQSPDNDEPCNAFLLNVTSTCNNTLGNNVNATASAGVPDPVCGNYAGGDVWYKTVVPANGHLYVISSAGTLTNGAIALYSGSCSSLTLIACENTQGPGEWGEMSFVGLNPGDTIWIRVWDENNNDVGDFNICVTGNSITPAPACNISTTAGATCATATSICSLDGYCGNTVSFGANFWPEMLTTFRSCLGNNNANIQNNSFLKFTAASSSAQFKVWVTSTTKGIGIQMMFFETATCGSGAVICHGGYDDIRPGPEKIITATGLTPGNTYYLMIDGVSNDLCNYVIGAVSGLSSLTVSSSAASGAICNGQSITLNASGLGSTFTWNWTNAGGPQTFIGSTLTDNPTQNTTYTVTASGVGICSGTRDIAVVVNENPIILLNSPVVCSGTAASLSAIPNPAGATYNYSWTVPGGAVNPGNQASFNSNIAGTYLVTATNASTGCVSNAGSGTITLLPLPTINVNSPSVCAGLAATLTANATASDPVSYTWTVPSGVTNPGNVATFSTTQAGNYTVTATNTVTNCVSSVANSTVTINALPQATIVNNNGPICSGTNGNFSLSGTSGSTVSYSINGGPLSSIVLTGGNASISVTSPAADQILSITNVNDGTCSQALTQSSTLQVNALRTPTFNSWGPYCLNDIIPTVTLPSSSIEGYTGIWTPSSVSTSAVGTITHTFTPDNPAQCAQPTTMNIIVNPLPSGVTAGPSATITQGAGVTLQGAGTGSYTWSPSTDLSNPNIANPIANPRATTIYTITVENSFGCKAEDSLIVTVIDNCVEPSKIFTPNNDGLYDNWIAYTGSCVKMVEANVYDRNGNLVYHSSDYKNNWNGSRNGKPLPDATYYYVLKITGINGLTYVRKGSVAIIR